MKKIIFILFVISLAGCAVLRDSLYQNTYIYVGSAVTLKTVQEDTAAMRVLLSDFNSITAENAMKMKSMFPQKDVINWKSADEYVNFAKKNNMRIHGHALLWHESVPEWLNEYANDHDAFDGIVTNYIHNYVEHYKNEVAGWDVVNEAISDSAGLFRKTLFYRVLGESYIEKAFRAANEANANALLFYNEYGIENDSVKLNAMLKMVDNLTAKNVPIHGIGMQMHITTDMDVQMFKRALHEIIKRGLLIHISELDVRVNQDNRYKRFNHNAAKQQKDMYYTVVKTYLDIVPRNQQYGVTLWGYSDAYSWIPHYFKTQDWPCIYDEKMKRKPAYNGMWKAFSE